MHLCLWPDSLVTRHELMTDSLSCFLVRRAARNVWVHSASSASGQMCAACKAISAWGDEEHCDQVYVGERTPTGQRDYSSRACRPEASQWITETNQLNQSCRCRVQQQDDHPSTQPALSISFVAPTPWPHFIHEMCSLSFLLRCLCVLMCKWH